MREELTRKRTFVPQHISYGRLASYNYGLTKQAEPALEVRLDRAEPQSHENVEIALMNEAPCRSRNCAVASLWLRKHARYCTLGNEPDRQGLGYPPFWG